MLLVHAAHIAVTLMQQCVMWQICGVCRHTVSVVADTGVHLELVPVLGNSHFHADDHDICNGLVTMTFVVCLNHSDHLASAESVGVGLLPTAKAEIQTTCTRKDIKGSSGLDQSWVFFGLTSCSLIWKMGLPATVSSKCF